MKPPESFPSQESLGEDIPRKTEGPSQESASDKASRSNALKKAAGIAVASIAAMISGCAERPAPVNEAEKEARTEKTPEGKMAEQGLEKGIFEKNKLFLSEILQQISSGRVQETERGTIIISLGGIEHGDIVANGKAMGNHFELTGSNLNELIAIAESYRKRIEGWQKSGGERFASSVKESAKMEIRRTIIMNATPVAEESVPQNFNPNQKGNDKTFISPDAKKFLTKK